MNIDRDTQNGSNPRWITGLLISASMIAVGVIASIAIRERSGPAGLALVAAVIANLAGALVFDLFTKRDGAVLGAMIVLMSLGALPLLWVSDTMAWIRENPLTFGAILLLAGFLRQRYVKTWPLYAVALVLGSAHLLISLF